MALSIILNLSTVLSGILKLSMALETLQISSQTIASVENHVRARVFYLAVKRRKFRAPARAEETQQITKSGRKRKTPDE
jgi:hypothetical protein